MDINEYQKFKAVSAALDECVEALGRIEQLPRVYCMTDDGDGVHKQMSEIARAALEQAKKARG